MKFSAQRALSYVQLFSKEASRKREGSETKASLLIGIAGALFSVLFLSACDGAGPGPSSSELRYFEFVHQSSQETFIAATADSAVIRSVREELSRPLSERTLHIIGPIERGRRYNQRYRWHFEESKWELTEFSTEVCDGRPSAVDENLGYWINTVGRYCPWNGQVVAEVKAPSGGSDISMTTR